MKSSKNKKLLAFFLAALGLSVNSLNVSAKNGQIRENIRFAFGMKCNKLNERNKLDKLADKIQEFLARGGEYTDEETAENINYSYIFNKLLKTLEDISEYRYTKGYNSKLYDGLNKKIDNTNYKNIFENYPGNVINVDNWENYINWIKNINSLVHGGNLTVFNGKIKNALSDLKDKMVNDKTFAKQINNENEKDENKEVENKQEVENEKDENKQDNKIIKVWSVKAYHYDANKREKEIENGVTCYLDKDGNLSLKLSQGVNKINNVYHASVGPESTKQFVKSITIPNSVEIIGQGAFSNFGNLEKIEIPDSVKTIEALAFGGCTKLEKITIPKSVKNINQSAFNSKNNLKKVKIAKNNPNKETIRKIFTNDFFGVFSKDLQIEEI